MQDEEPVDLRTDSESSSPDAGVHGQPCNTVTYTNRSICAFKGSSVDISCTYNSHKDKVEAKFWFRPQHGHQWQNPSEPGDLGQDSQYSSRVQVLETETRFSTLRITNLRESDSSENRFKFKTPSFEWGSSLSGTTLTVTALQIVVTRIVTVHESYTEAELNCHSSCSPTGHFSYVWFKNGQKLLEETSTYTHDFYPGDSITCAFKGYEGHRSPSVYALEVPSVSVSPSGQIVEGSSVTLTCSSDANPAANYTWYKENPTLHEGPEGNYHFTSVSSEDRGIYHCKTENQFGQINSSTISLYIQYPPKLPSVSVSPSGQIVEGSSVTLTCSSDANPAANYTWYKENEDSPKASGQIFTITDFRAEHSGNYYCEAQNERGRYKSTLYLTVVAGTSVPCFVVLVILLCIFLWRSRGCALCSPSVAV
ncbi:B-cell receptor CD22 [Lates calcarifer]|uniref:B-cell receptor CD22 n=1 Tax=Lates calcarifer TaxID=8187 RepID=A0AAJ8B5Q7_LATCA|nr:B-cell receptor CD22 [Lates calcarifer]